MTVIRETWLRTGVYFIRPQQGRRRHTATGVAITYVGQISQVETSFGR